MFSLIVTIISIALVMALAIATLYYGGVGYTKGGSNAAANALVNQATQIAAAGAIATAQGSGWPVAAPQFSQPFLARMPVPPKASYSAASATPAAADWEYFLTAGTSHHFVLKNKISKEVCLAVNKIQGLIGIPAAWDGTSLIQCFGTGNGATPAQYTFFYDPPGSTPGQNQAASDRSVQDATTAGVSGVTPGYPRLCPDNTTITSGVCADSSGGAPGGGPLVTAPNPSLYWVVQITQMAGGMGGRAYGGSITDNGTAAICPAGGVDAGLLSPGATGFNLHSVTSVSPPPVSNGANSDVTYCIPISSTDYVAFDGSLLPASSTLTLTGPAWTDNPSSPGLPDFLGSYELYKIQGKGVNYILGGLRYRWGVDGPGWTSNGQQNGTLVGISRIAPSSVPIKSAAGTNASVNLDPTTVFSLN